MPNFRKNLAVKIETPGGDNPLLLTMVGTPPYYRGVALSGVALQGRGGTPPYAYAIIAGALPTGVSLNGISGALTGTPTTPGHYTFVAQVQDAAANVFPQRFSMDIKSHLFVIAGTPREGEVDLAYSYQFIVADAANTHLTSGYSVVSGTIPAGLTFHSNGILDGTPTAPDGISYFTVEATDGTDTIQFAVQITIYPELVFAFFQEFMYIVGTYSENFIVVTGGKPPYSFKYFDPTDPYLHGVKLDARGKIYGTALQTYNQSRDIVVTDALGAVKDAFVELNFVDPNGKIQPQNNGGDVGPIGPTVLNFVEGPGIDIDVTNSAGTTTVEISASGGGGSGISTINNIYPDSSGNFSIVSDGSISIVENSNGELEFSVVGGGSQAGIQFEDQGSNLGTAGTVTELDFVGTGVTATRVSNKVTVTVPGATGTFVESINGIGPDSGGNVSIVPGTGISIEPTSNGDIEISTTGGATQAGIQWKDEGSNLGSSGTADTVNVVGNGATASRVSTTVTLTIPGPDTFNGIDFFGDGSDGSVVLDGTNTYPTLFTKTGNTYTALRDLYLDNLTFSGAGNLAYNGSCIFVYGTADFSASTSGTVVIKATNNNQNGTTATGPTGGAGGGSSSAFTLQGGTSGANGGAGNVAAAGSNGSNGTNSTNPAIGTGSTQRAGAGGAGASGAGGAGGNPANGPSTSIQGYRRPTPPIVLSRLTGLVTLGCGSGGPGGGGGGGDVGAQGGGGGGGGGGGANCWLGFRAVVRGTVTISAAGGTGGGGFHPPTLNRGGGGGGTGGGGAALHFVYRSVSGSGTLTLDASGGTGGTGATGNGTGINGSGGAGGDSGYVLAYNCATGNRSFTNSGASVAGGAAGGVGVVTAGTGGVATMTI